ncbi:MAG: hypothetical protein M1816_005910 [Peltula sp. TS41687]|nr:MAG: hypothetical protein M1816_005910 [Peltula sp. TS41687]
MNQELPEGGEIETPFTVRLPAKLVDLAFSIAAFQRSGHQHAQIIEQNAKYVNQGIISQYPLPERFQQTERRSTRHNPQQDTPWPTNWATDQRALGQSLYEFITEYSRVQSAYSATVTRENSVSGPSGESTESSTTTSTAEKESTTIHKDDQRVYRSPTIELPQDIPRITPEKLQHLMQTTINTAMDRRFGAENAANRNAGPPEPPGPPIPPAPSGGVGFVAPYQSNNTTMIRARHIGYFDPDATKSPVELKDTHQVYHNVFSFTNQLKAKAVTLGEALFSSNVANCLIGEAERWYTEEISNLTRRGLQIATIQEWSDVLEKRFRDEPSKSLLTVMQERYTVQDVRRRREPTEYMQLMVAAGQNAHRDANEAVICMLATSWQVSGKQGLYGSTYTLPTTSIQDKEDPTTDGSQIPLKNDVDYSLDASTRRILFQDIAKTHGVVANPTTGTTVNNAMAQIASPHRNTTRIETRIAPGKARDLKEVINNERDNGIKGQNRPWLNRLNNGPSRLQNGGTTNMMIPVKAYHGDPAEGHENAYEEYANEPTDDTPSYDDHQEYEAYEEEFYGSEAYHRYYYTNDPSTSGEGQQHGSTQDTRPTESTDVNFTPIGTVHECRNCEGGFESKNKLHRHIRTICSRTTKNGPKETSFGAKDIHRMDTLGSKFHEQVDVLETVVESNASDDVKGGYGFRGWEYVIAMVKLHAMAKAEPLCLDTGCTMSIIDREFLHVQAPHAVVRKMASAITV